MDIGEILGGIITIIIGVVILRALTEALVLPFGYTIIGFFLFVSILWFLKEVFNL